VSPAEWSAIELSLRVAAVATAVSLPLGVAVAYGLARRRFPAPFVVETVVSLPLVLPPVVTGYALLVVFAGNIAFSWIAAAFAAGVMGFPLLVQTARVAFEAVDPQFEEAGLVDGATRWSVFRRVTLPLAARGVAAGAALAFARALGEFGATIVVAGNIPGETQTIPLAIFTGLNQAGGEAAVLRLIAISVALSVGSLLVYTLLTRRLHGDRGQ
jgi:molybdate transport system permease protein